MEWERADRPAPAAQREHRACHSQNGRKRPKFLRDAGLTAYDDFNALNPRRHEPVAIACLERACVTSGVFNESQKRAVMRFATNDCRSRRDEWQKREVRSDARNFSLGVKSGAEFQ
jgi:hypothetical protein